ncbi:MarR family winged helix-turn-helix transcriptional regulator [Nocardioides sp. T2.26MG-1]|uniref:MarR family winged helix-turn-helix transcriptional regulator n=1 Tax=Nocardioides sp. T2.26MG-1 TaxID=3041166 RepID=UPI002477C9D7|nr:MarR family transcriptional regulator [Nocardioides sp. T2.26MG-1]CAI9412673.1 hypothetical protein HIDPHFAB_01831 [Nocardioides sp. T2.26MG-1]
MDDTSPAWLTDSEMAAWRALMQTFARLPVALDQQLQRDADLSFLEYYVLASLSEAPDGVLGMSSLAILTSSEQSRLSHLMKRMEAKGLARRERDPANGRQTNAHITDRGWERIRQAAPGHVAAVRSLVFDPLSATDVQALARICRHVLDQLGPYRAG